MSTKLNDLNVASMIFAAKGDGRPALEYLKIVEDKAIVTDGHILIATTLPQNDLDVASDDLLKQVEAKTPILSIGLDSSYGKKVFEFIEKFVGAQKKTNFPKVVKLSFYGPTEAIKIEATNTTTEQKLVALLMPCRIE